MSEKLILDRDYRDWIGQLSNRYRTAQIKAAVAVNTEMLKFYWELGHDIVRMQSENKYGSHFFETLSRDLKEAIPEAKGLSVKSLYYIKRFYLMYSKIFPQIEGISEAATCQDALAKFPQIEGILFQIPWMHHKLLIDKYFNEPETALFYVRETVKHGWSRSVLDHMLDTNLHLRHGKAISNFNSLLIYQSGYRNINWKSFCLTISKVRCLQLM